jgi:hypothetical protein
MLEAIVERALKRLCKKKLSLCIKSETLARGFPDRMVLAFPRRVEFVELKRIGTTLEPAQRIWRKRLRLLGFSVPVLHTPEQVEKWGEEFFS